MLASRVVVVVLVVGMTACGRSALKGQASGHGGHAQPGSSSGQGGSGTFASGTGGNSETTDAGVTGLGGAQGTGGTATRVGTGGTVAAGGSGGTVRTGGAIGTAGTLATGGRATSGRGGGGSLVGGDALGGRGGGSSAGGSSGFGGRTGLDAGGVDGVRRDGGPQYVLDATDGVASSGGIKSTGGVQSGGTVGTGGVGRSGGAVGSGGIVATGGVPSGGTVASGGGGGGLLASGGRVGSGGNSALGGSGGTGGFCGDGIVGPGEQCDLGPDNQATPAFRVTQAGLSFDAIPLVRSGSAGDFYSYSSASAHTRFEDVGTSRMLLHLDRATRILSLVFFHGIDQDTTGQSQPTSQVVMNFSGLPESTAVEVSDDSGELVMTSNTTATGLWNFANNSDGGVLSGLQLPGDWTITIDPSFIMGITTWTWIQSDGSFIDLDLSAPLTIQARSTHSQCRPDCTIPQCGDGILDGGEVCDDGQPSPSGCATNCMSFN